MLKFFFIDDGIQMESNHYIPFIIIILNEMEEMVEIVIHIHDERNFYAMQKKNV